MTARRWQIAAGKRSQCFGPGQNAERAVEPATAGHGVEVRAEHDEIVGPSPQCQPEVAGLVDVLLDGHTAIDSRSQFRASRHGSVHATRCAPSSVAVRLRSSFRSSMTRRGSIGNF